MTLTGKLTKGCISKEVILNSKGDILGVNNHWTPKKINKQYKSQNLYMIMLKCNEYATAEYFAIELKFATTIAPV